MRFHWPQQCERWLNTVLTGHYRLSLMQVYRRHHKSWVQWSALDSLVLKWVALQVEHELPKHPYCHHLKGHGGVAGATKRVTAAWQSQTWRYVFRTDIRGYYRHIPKQAVERLLNMHIAAPVLRTCVCSGCITALKRAARCARPRREYAGAVH